MCEMASDWLMVLHLANPKTGHIRILVFDVDYADVMT